MGGIVAAILLAALHVDLAGQNIRLTLEEALDMIEEENLRVLVERQLVEESFQAARGERSGLLPEISFDVSQIRTLIANVGTGFGGLPSLPPVSRFDGKFVGSMPLVDVVRFTAWRLSKFEHQISQLNYDDVLQDVLDSTANAFYTHLRNLRRVEVIEANIERDRVLLDLATNQLRAGVATRIDVTRAEVALASDERDRLQQETVVKESELLVKILLNLDLDVPLELVMPDPLKPTPTHAYNLDVMRILGSRPDYQKAVLELERNRVARKLAGYENLPTVNLFGEWGTATSEVFDGDGQESWLTGISVSIPIFEGFRIKSNKQRAEAVVMAQEFAVREIEQQVGADYRLAVQDVESRYKQIDISRKKLSLNEEELELARTRFIEGVADNREIVDAQAALADANDEFIDTVYQYNLSRLRLARIRGDVRLVLTD